MRGEGQWTSEHMAGASGCLQVESGLLNSEGDSDGGVSGDATDYIGEVSAVSSGPQSQPWS